MPNTVMGWIASAPLVKRPFSVLPKALGKANAGLRGLACLVTLARPLGRDGCRSRTGVHRFESSTPSNWWRGDLCILTHFCTIAFIVHSGRPQELIASVYLTGPCGLPRSMSLTASHCTHKARLGLSNGPSSRNVAHLHMKAVHQFLRA